MLREYKVYLKDILRAISKIERYTGGISYKDFMENELIQDGVVRNLEIIGEAVKNIPESIRSEEPDVEWRKIAGLRDILTHAYFEIDIEILWDIIKKKLPTLKEKTLEILSRK